MENLWQQTRIAEVCKTLDIYTTYKRNEVFSEHEHYGPYCHLKIMTWDESEITEAHIAGSIVDLKSLKGIISCKLSWADAGQTFTIGSEYGTNNPAIAKVFVMDDNLDPVSMDQNLSH